MYSLYARVRIHRLQSFAQLHELLPKCVLLNYFTVCILLLGYLGTLSVLPVVSQSVSEVLLLTQVLTVITCHLQMLLLHRNITYTFLCNKCQKQQQQIICLAVLHRPLGLYV